MILLDVIRTWSSRFFHRFGIHCATHQIRLILISGLVITSLFYPAIGIYLDSLKRFLPDSSSRFIGPLFGLSPNPYSDFRDDLDNVWDGYASLRILEDTVARARCGTEKTVRVERVLLTCNGFDSDAGAINYELLHSALQLETDIRNRLSTSGLKCLSADTRDCLVLSPLEFWSHDEDALRSDSDFLRLINKRRNISVAGLPLKPSMVFAGREAAEPGSHTVDFAAYLALTYFFHDDDCNTSEGHRSWLNILSDIDPSLDEIPRTLQEPSLQALEFNPERKTSKRISLITATLYLSYMIFFIYFSGSMRRMDTVHSRIGLCFTGLVEILVSTITSISVCAIIGLRITLVPWGIFPIVIVFVGAENMFRLVDDVTKTPISLPVKERIGVGLGRAGTSNTLKVVSYNTILGVIAFFSHGAIRQFCAFAIVVLVAHWFLIHTFFVAVLSIDIQRLELDDLIRQDSNLAPRNHDSNTAKYSSKVNVLSEVMGGVQRATKGRLAKNFSLMLLLVITATLYYSTLPASSVRHTDAIRTPATRASVRQAKAEQAKLDVHSDASKIWHALNPDENTLVHLKVEVPTILVFDNHQKGNRAREHRIHRSRWSARTLRACRWIFKVMVLPIGATLSALYVLLLYLLKGTDRLDNHRPDTEDNKEDVTVPIKDVPSFETFPRTFATDVSLLASSQSGSVLASTSSDGEVVIWLASSGKYMRIDTSELVLESTSAFSRHNSLCAISVDDNGNYVGLGTCSGVIGIWEVYGDKVFPIGQLSPDECPSPVVQIEFSSSHAKQSKALAAPEIPSARMRSNALPDVLTVHANGRAFQWVNGIPMPCPPSLCSEVIKTKLLSPLETGFPAVCFFYDNGELEIVDIYQSSATEDRILIRAGSSEDYVEDADACVLEIGGSSHVLVAAVTYSGIVSLWDGTMGERIIVLDEAMGVVNNIRVLSIPSKACSQCGEVPLCTFSLAYSVGHIVLLERGILAQRCLCPLNQPLVSKVSAHRDSSMGRRSRSGSFVSSSGADNISRSRSRHVSLSSETPPTPNSFPVSAHGVHSRRGSEKEASRRMNDKFDTPAFLAIEDLNGGIVEGVDHLRPTFPALTQSSSSLELHSLKLWRNFRLVRVREATCERGGWGILSGKVLGVRRRPRTRHSEPDERVRYSERSSQQLTLSSSVLDRWEVWIYDPSQTDGTLQASSLSMLRHRSSRSEGTTGTTSQKPRLPFTRLSPLVIKSTVCLGGFGNTVGMIDFGTTKYA